MGTRPVWFNPFGHCSGLEGGEAEIVLLAPRHVPPPFVRPTDAPTIGTVGEDGSLSISLPESFPEEEFVPVAQFLDPDCSDASLEPPDAVYFPITYGLYRADGSLVGEVFLGSSGAERGPLPGEFTTLPGYGHEIVQSFTEHPEKAGWRIDQWRNEPVPEQAVWLLIGPPG